MAQEIKIGVQADVASAEQNVKRLEDAADRAAAAVRKIGDAGASADRELGKLDQSTRRLEQTQKTLSREFGRKISESDTAQFLANFGNLKQGRGPGAARVRAFNSFDDWYRGHAGSFSKASAAARHRRVVMATAMQGTSDTAEHGYAPMDGPPAPSSPPPGVPGESGGGGSSSGGGGWMGKAASTVAGFTGAGLALAGIGSVMSMAGKAIDMAQREGLSTDNIKRRLGGLGVDYYDAQSATRSAAGYLRTDYVGAAALGQEFVGEAGNMTGRDLNGLGGMLSNAGRFASAYGMDPSTTVGFMGSMRRLGVAGDEQSQRKLAGEIADAIDRSGYAAKADELVRAIGGYADTVSHASLSRANVLGYASALTGLTSSGLPGLDPSGAASILNNADASLRRGGNAGEAGQNFLFQALSQGGMGPFAIQALMQGGLFASTNSIFGSNSATSGWYKGKLSGETNLDRIRGLVKRFGWDPQRAAASMSSVFGGSLADNSALLTLQGKPLADKEQEMRARAAESDPAVVMQQSLNKMADALTNAGGPLISVLNPIRDAVVDLANHFMPNRLADASNRNFAGNDVSRGNTDLNAWINGNSDRRGSAGAMLRRALRAQADVVGRGGTFDISSYAKGIPDAHLRGGIQTGLMHQRDWIAALNKGDGELGFAPGTGVRQAMKESGFDPGAQSGKGAMGLMQLMPDTVKGLAPRFRARFGHDPNPWDPIDSIRMRDMLLNEDLKRSHGDQKLALQYYQGGFDRSHWGSQNASYTDGVLAANMPPSEASRMAAASSGTMKHEVTGTAIIQDASGQPRGKVILQGVGQPQASGAS